MLNFPRAIPSTVSEFCTREFYRELKKLILFKNKELNKSGKPVNLLGPTKGEQTNSPHKEYRIREPVQKKPYKDRS